MRGKLNAVSPQKANAQASAAGSNAFAQRLLGWNANRKSEIPWFERFGPLLGDRAASVSAAETSAVAVSQESEEWFATSEGMESAAVSAAAVPQESEEWFACSEGMESAAVSAVAVSQESEACPAPVATQGTAPEPGTAVAAADEETVEEAVSSVTSPSMMSEEVASASSAA